jgi:hypothetical protein
VSISPTLNTSGAVFFDTVNSAVTFDGVGLFLTAGENTTVTVYFAPSEQIMYAATVDLYSGLNKIGTLYLEG